MYQITFYKPYVSSSTECPGCRGDVATNASKCPACRTNFCARCKRATTDRNHLRTCHCRAGCEFFDAPLCEYCFYRAEMAALAYPYPLRRHLRGPLAVFRLILDIVSNTHEFVDTHYYCPSCKNSASRDFPEARRYEWIDGVDLEYPDWYTNAG